MKYEEIINEVKSLYPSEYDESQMTDWINELEGNISIYRGDVPCKIQSLSDETSVSAPFDRMYTDFVMAQISLHQHDDEAYARYINMFNARYTTWKGYYMSVREGEKHQYKNWI